MMAQWCFVAGYRGPGYELSSGLQTILVIAPPRPQLEVLGSQDRCSAGNIMFLLRGGAACSETVHSSIPSRCISLFSVLPARLAALGA